MRKFREAYREAVEQLPKLHMTPEDVQELAHAAFAEKSKRGFGNRLTGRSGALGACAAAVFLLCGVGTVVAVNYHSSRINVEQNGFSITGENLQNTQPDAGEIGLASLTGSEAEKRSAWEMDQGSKEYDSLEGFLETDHPAIALPDKAWLNTSFEEEFISVLQDGEMITVMLCGEGKCFMMTQQDNRACEGYASATSYLGESVNERSFTGGQGLTFTMFDTMQDGEIVSTHAVISVNGRDLSISFEGYPQSVIEDVLKRLDLGIYFAE